jgi:hypothetical protein
MGVWLWSDNKSASSNNQKRFPGIQIHNKIILMIRSQDKILKTSWAKRFEALSPESKQALKEALNDLRADALNRANHSWKKHKAPMALYWKVVGVYSGHLAKSIK